jgi:uncharacterized protein
VLYDHPQHPPLPEGWGFRLLLGVAALMRSLGALVAMITSSILLTFLFIPLMDVMPMPRRLGENLLNGPPSIVMALGISALLVRYAHKLRLRDLGFTLDRAAVRACLLWTVLGAIALALTVVPLLLMGQGEFAPANARIRGLGGITLVTVLLFTAAVGEELITRGYPFQTLVQPLHLLGAVIATSAPFAAMHAQNPGANEFSLANTFLAGCILGMIVAYTRTVWTAAGAHFGWNIATALFGLNISGLVIPFTPYTIKWTADPLWTGGRYGPEGGVACTIVLCLLLFITIHLYHRKEDALRPILPEPPQ